MMKFHFLPFAALLGLLAACSSQAVSAPTPLPLDYLPTAIVLTGQAAFATASALAPTSTSPPLPTSTPLPPAPTEPSDVPTEMPTLAPGFTNYAEIRFVAPGPMSALTSPFVLQAVVAAGESDKIQVELLGEDGRVLYRNLKKLDRNPKGVFQRFEISFEIRAVSEVGYIRISSADDFGRMQALNTMPVLLNSVGAPQINPPGNFIYERIAMDGFKEKSEYYGGQVLLNGRIWPFNDKAPVVVELIASDGKILSSRILNMQGDQTQSFETTLPYKISEQTTARLTFRQDNLSFFEADAELGRLIYVYSAEVILNP
ncbi:MAG: hypothetical protein LC099_06635 [Anaerolineales bacterium]|nr:hypothetical protein [Anaerolineales bacterium]